jgi:ABC-type transport system involved in multi-copper enzyme maturation permease subunit
MSIAVSTPKIIAVPQEKSRPTFLGTLHGELLKISRQRSIWIMSILLLGFMCVPYAVSLLRPSYHDVAKSDPLTQIYFLTQVSLIVVRAFGGFYLVILAALVVGLEYQQGTIRILLARGVGKLELLGAKVVAIALVALGIVVADLIVQAILTPGFMLVATGSLSGLSSVNSKFWSDSALYLLTVLISMGATLLLAVAATVVGRSLAFGVGVGLSWFAADNIGVIMTALMAELTHNAWWLNVPGYFLGPLLNLLPALMVPARTIVVYGEKGMKTVAAPPKTAGFQPMVTVSETQTLLVILGYAVVFAVIAIALTWRRDVLE